MLPQFGLLHVPTCTLHGLTFGSSCKAPKAGSTCKAPEASKPSSSATKPSKLEPTSSCRCPITCLVPSCLVCCLGLLLLVWLWLLLRLLGLLGLLRGLLPLLLLRFLLAVCLG
jgi:hypothetical protein